VSLVWREDDTVIDVSALMCLLTQLLQSGRTLHLELLSKPQSACCTVCLCRCCRCAAARCLTPCQPSGLPCWTTLAQLLTHTTTTLQSEWGWRAVRTAAASCQELGCSCSCTFCSDWGMSLLCCLQVCGPALLFNQVAISAVCVVQYMAHMYIYTACLADGPLLPPELP
jgi:hypothetical protein